MKQLLKTLIHRLKELYYGKYIPHPVDDTHTLFRDYYKRNK